MSISKESFQVTLTEREGDLVVSLQRVGMLDPPYVGVITPVNGNISCNDIGDAVGMLMAQALGLEDDEEYRRD